MRSRRPSNAPPAARPAGRLVGRRRPGRRRRCGAARRTEAQGGVRHPQDVAALVGDDLQVGGHAGQEGHVAVVDADHRRVGDDVLDRLRAEPDGAHGAGEGAVRIGVDREAHALACLEPPDIGLVDIGVDVDLAQVLGDGEQRRRVEGGGDGLAEVDLALHDDAVDRRADIRALEIDLDVPELGLALQDHGLGGFQVRLGEGDVGVEPLQLGAGGGDLRLGGGEGGLLHLGLGAGGVERRLRADPAREQLLLTLEIAPRIGELRARAVALRQHVLHGRLGALPGRLRALDLGAPHGEVGPALLEIGPGGVAPRLDLLRIKPGDHLTRLHRAVVVGEDLDDLARELRADQHRGHRVEGAGGAHARRDRPAIDARQAIRHVGGAAARRAPRDEADGAGQSRDAGRDAEEAAQERLARRWFSDTVHRGHFRRFPRPERVNSLSRTT